MRDLSSCGFMFFFFSSRRRHTRWPRDWSSDVCSSDLMAISVALPAVVYVQISGRSVLSGERMMLAAIGCGVLAVMCYLLRSEERRVGKESRHRWSPEHEENG